MDLKRLRYFCSVVDHGSFSQAARMLNMAQPPLSKRVQELEQELGVQLLVRGEARIRPTAAGHHLYQRAAGILREVDDAVSETVTISQHRHKLLRVGLTHLFQRHFSGLLLELHRCNPEVEIVLTVSDSGHLKALLREGQIDVALIQRPHNQNGLAWIDEPPIPMVAVASPSLADRVADEMALDALGELPLIMLRRSEGVGTYEALVTHLRNNGIDPHVIMSISQPEVILEWLNGGLEAVALLPASEVVPEMFPACRVVQLRQAPIVFFPALVRQATAQMPPEICATLDSCRAAARPVA